MLFKCLTADLDLCGAICTTIDSVTHWIFVGEIYARRYATIFKRDPENEPPEMEPSHGEVEDKMDEVKEGDIIKQDFLKEVSELFAVVLRFCFEIKKLGLKSGGSVLKDNVD